MSDRREQRIRERAYVLWEADGRPEGGDHARWLRAETLIDAEDDPSSPDMTDTPPL